MKSPSCDVSDMGVTAELVEVGLGSRSLYSNYNIESCMQGQVIAVDVQSGVVDTNGMDTPDDSF